MAISRMQNPQQLQGIGSLRQPYGLGKLVKKAFRGLKKVVKSPIGKAAILGGLGMWGMGAGPWASGGMWGKAKGAGFLKNLWGASKASSAGQGLGGWANKWLNPFNTKNPLLYTKGAFSGKKAFGLGAAGLIAAPFIQKKLGWGPYQDEEEEGPDWSVTPSSISNIVSQARARDPSLDFLPSSAYTQSGWYGADGGRAGLLNGGEAGEAQMEQMLRAEYLKYRNQGGTMPYEQFKILVMKQAQQGQTPNQMMAAGGRAGFENGELVEQQTDLIEGPQGGEEFQETVVEGQEQPSQEQLEALAMEIFQLPLEELDEEQLLVVYQEAMQGQPMEEAVQEEDVQFAARGGRMGFQEGGWHPGVGRDESGYLSTHPSFEGGNNEPPVVSGGDGGTNVITQAPVVKTPSTFEKFKNYIGWGENPVVEEDQSEAIVPTSGKFLDPKLDEKKTALASSVSMQDLGLAQGGRAGYANGELVTDESMMAATPTGMMEENVEEVQGEPTREELEALAMEIFQLPLEELDEKQLMIVYQAAMQGQPMEEAVQEDVQFAARGGRMGFQMGGDDDEEVTYNPYKAMDMYKRTRRQEGGLMDLGGMEKDYRENGGFVPLGGEERADDVPARLSKNEFVFTADAVRAAGGGDIDAGSEVMQNVMDNLEQGGEVSEESQGQNPAQGMYNNYEQLQSRVG